MERVAFLIEDTGERIGCLLNPSSFAVRRHAGIHPRRSLGGQLSGAGLTDDPLLFTGGGYTELQLDLLFDVSLAGAPPTSTDVRDFTGPLSRLAENAGAPDRYGRPPLVRFVWGKSWNVPGVVVAVAERFEQFDAGGNPRRSWLRLRLVRVTEPPTPPADAGGAPGVLLQAGGTTAPASPADVVVHEVVGAGPDADQASDANGEEAAPISGERLDEIASRYYGNPALWKLLAELNNIDDPLHLPPGSLLRIPPLPGGGTPT
jgi:hypothetical protein